MGCDKQTKPERVRGVQIVQIVIDGAQRDRNRFVCTFRTSTRDRSGHHAVDNSAAIFVIIDGIL